MKWRKFTHIENLDLVDDKNYLVRWIDYEGTKLGTLMAYWIAVEGRFFPLHGDNAFPLDVDEWLEIPEA